ncbi:MAG: CYTH domain-containing protein [Reyranellales bacterium]
MATEIERKFLVANDSWRQHCTRIEQIRDGLIARTGNRKVRVRICGERATIAIKAKHKGFTDAEFEYEIPMADAEELLTSHCGEYLLTKICHHVPYKGFMWQVDVYQGILEGMTLAEVELPRADIDVPLPDWVGAEVTGKPEFRKFNLHKAQLDRVRSPAPTR